MNGYDLKSNFSNNNFINQNDLLHNNLNNILLTEEVREYSVMIDSKDRNYQIYPDPYNYNVIFDPLPRTKEIINGKVIYHEEPNPIINSNFTNVRYIKLESIILPFYNKTIKDKIDITKPLTNNLYTVLSLGEYTDTNYRSTNDVLSESFAIIYYNNKINDTHYKGITYNGIKIFPKDELARIDKLKISFMDPYGNLIKCNNLDKNIKSNMECYCDNNENDDCFIHNLSHPLNPIFQHHLLFKIGVIESRLNKKIFN